MFHRAEAGLPASMIRVHPERPRSVKLPRYDERIERRNMNNGPNRRQKRRPPKGKCTDCGEEVPSLTMSPDQRCPHCRRGVIRSMWSEGDWKEWEACEATGFVGRSCAPNAAARDGWQPANAD